MLERIMKKWVEVSKMDSSFSGLGHNTNELSGSNHGNGNLATTILALLFRVNLVNFYCT